MQTSIFITGQISGNTTLVNAISTYDSEMKKTMFNGYEITFKTKSAAKKALWEAFKYLRQDKEDARASMLSYRKYGILKYDASSAQILIK